MTESERLIYFRSEELCLDKNGLRLIENIRPGYGIVPVAAVGPGRIGKSCLLNYLHGEKTFEVGSTTSRVTKGIMIAIDYDDFKKHAYLYFDVEGFGDPNTATKTDNQLLAIVAALCDVLLYNTRGVLDQELKNKLEMSSISFERYRKQIEVLTKPAIVVVLRDFGLDIPEDPNKQLLDLFESSLDATNPTSCFRSINTFILPTPAGRAQLRELDMISDEHLDAEFVANRYELKTFLRQNAQPLCTHTSKHLPGQVFGEYLDTIVNAIKKDNIGNLTKMVRDLLKEKNVKMKEEAVRDYKRQMEKDWPDRSSPDPLHYRLQTLEKNELQDKLFDIDDQPESLLQQFQAETRKTFHTLSEEKSTKMLKCLRLNLEKKYSGNEYFKIDGTIEFKRDMADLEQKYKQLNNLGPRAAAVWNAYENTQRGKLNEITQREDIMRKNEKETKRMNAEIAKKEQNSERSRQELERLENERDMLIQNAFFGLIRFGLELYFG